MPILQVITASMEKVTNVLEKGGEAFIPMMSIASMVSYRLSSKVSRYLSEERSWTKRNWTERSQTERSQTQSDKIAIETAL